MRSTGAVAIGEEEKQRREEKLKRRKLRFLEDVTLLNNLEVEEEEDDDCRIAVPGVALIRRPSMFAACKNASAVVGVVYGGAAERR